jgi:hypothetical protein
LPIVDYCILAVDVEDVSEDTEATASFPPAYVPIPKLSRKEQRDEMVAAKKHADAKNIRTVLPGFSAKHFDSFADFHKELAIYSARTNTSFSVRTSNKREWWNR